MPRWLSCCLTSRVFSPYLLALASRLLFGRGRRGRQEEPSPRGGQGAGCCEWESEAPGVAGAISDDCHGFVVKAHAGVQHCRKEGCCNGWGVRGCGQLRRLRSRIGLRTSKAPVELEWPSGQLSQLPAPRSFGEIDLCGNERNCRGAAKKMRLLYGCSATSTRFYCPWLTGKLFYVLCGLDHCLSNHFYAQLYFGLEEHMPISATGAHARSIGHVLFVFWGV
jgi:hypothetical protein